MVFIADNFSEHKLWDYITGDEYKKQDEFKGIYEGGKLGMSIVGNRYQYLGELLGHLPSSKIALRDPSNDYWTKWVSFPGPLLDIKKNKYGFTSCKQSAAIDVHRSVLPNEVVIESDYPTYEENYEASKIIGAILEHKGFVPHYYYSGNKSIHIHVFLDWNILDAVYWDDFEDRPKEIGEVIEKDIKNFQKKFMEWLRTKMITCWGLKAREFDTDLINASHLIRAELSKNKKGFKTFLGYTHLDLSYIPYVCNEDNGIYPRLAKVIKSQPLCMKELIEEFQESRLVKSKIEKIQKKNQPLSRWVGTTGTKTLRDCVKAILSDDFKKVNDGFKRAMFILVNELRAVYGDVQATILINDWNNRMGNPVRQGEIDYRFKTKNYTLTCERIHKFLSEVGISYEGKCTRKVYK